MRTVAFVLLVAWLVVGSLLGIYIIGKPRKPWKPSDAVVGLIINGLAVWAVWFLWAHP